MEATLVKAGCYVGIMVLGYILRKCGFFGPETFGVLSKIVLRITLPCAIIANSAGKAVDLSMLTVVLLGFGACVLYMLLGALAYRKKGREQLSFAILNCTGYNIGTFAMPFTMSFLGPTGIITTSLFDMGTAFLCLGGAYGVARSVKEGSGFDIKRIIKSLVTSVPFMTHFIMVTVNLLRLTPPAPIVSFAQIVGNGNTFLAMLMIGVGFNLSGDKNQAGDIAKILGIRYGLAAILALGVYFLTPFQLEVRQTLVLLLFAPIGAAIPVFTAEMKGDVGLSSAINSMTILISIVIIVLLLLVML